MLQYRKNGKISTFATVNCRTGHLPAGNEETVARNKNTGRLEIKIDIDKILKDKMGRKARYVPRFLTSYLKHIVHQDWVNGFLVQAENLRGSAWLKACLEYQDIKIKVNGTENLPSPDDGKLYTFVSNHPLGGIDGVAVGAVIGSRYNDNFKYLVNDLLMNLPGLAPLCVGINKTGKNGRDFPKTVDATFKENQHVVMFPAGLCSRKTGGVIKDIPWKSTFIKKSVETGRDIVPIHFGGRNSDFFYNLANLCKRLRIKFNFAQLYLADEMYKNNHKTFTITIGKPIPVSTFDGSRKSSQWAQWVYDRVYALADNREL